MRRSWTRCLPSASAFVEAGRSRRVPSRAIPSRALFRASRKTQGVINRFVGFNSEGLDAFVARLEARPAPGIVGINLGKNKQTEDAAEDYVTGIAATARHASYLVCNLSSPHTHPACARSRPAAPCRSCVPAPLRPAIRRSRPVPARPPLLVKIAPDLEDAALEDVCAVALATGVDGIILGNTTISRPPHPAQRPFATNPAGSPARPCSRCPPTGCGRSRASRGGAFPCRCGGVASGRDAYAKVRAGAHLLQLYSARLFHGPGLVREIKRDSPPA